MTSCSDRRFRGRHRLLDMLDQLIRQLQPAGQQIEVTAFGARFRIDRQARGRVDLDPLLFRLGGRSAPPNRPEIFCRSSASI